MYCFLGLLFVAIQHTKGCDLSADSDSAERCPTIITASESGADGAFCDDFKYTTGGVDGLDGWTIHTDTGTGSTTSNIQTVADGSNPIEGKYHGDFSGAEIYAQGTVNSFYRYFQCSTNSKIRVKFNVASCGTELEDNIFFEIDGVQLGDDTELGCIDYDRPNDDTGLINYAKCFTSDFRGAREDEELESICPGDRSGNRCGSGEYNNLGTYSFNEVSAQTVQAYTPFQARFFFRYSYTDDHIWIYNIQLGCETVNGEDEGDATHIHESTDEDFKWGRANSDTCIPCGYCLSAEQCNTCTSATCDATDCSAITNWPNGCTSQECVDCCNPRCDLCSTCIDDGCFDDSCATCQPACNWDTISGCVSCSDNPDAEGCCKEPGFTHDQYLVALEGQIEWDGASIINKLGSGFKGYIGQITEEAAKPRFDEVFSVSNDRGLLCSIKIDTNGFIWLVSWTLGLGYFHRPTSENIGDEGTFYYIKDCDPSAANGCSSQSANNFFCIPTQDVCPYDIFIEGPETAYTLDDLARVSLDGIVYISQNANDAFGSKVLPQPQPNEDDNNNIFEPEEYNKYEPIGYDTRYEPIIDFIESPMGFLYFIMGCLSIGIGIGCAIKVMSFCVYGNDKNKYSKVKIVTYNDSETE